MSNIVFHCPKCGQKIKAPQIMTGEVGDCPNCKTPLIIPDPTKKAHVPTVSGPRGALGAGGEAAAQGVTPPQPTTPPFRCPPVSGRPVPPTVLGKPVAARGSAVGASQSNPAPNSAGGGVKPVVRVTTGTASPAVQNPAVAAKLAAIPGPSALESMPVAKAPGNSPVPAVASAARVPVATAVRMAIPSGAALPQAVPVGVAVGPARSVPAKTGAPAAVSAKPSTTAQPQTPVRTAAAAPAKASKVVAEAAKVVPSKPAAASARRSSFNFDEKPGFLRVVPAILSVMPGLGQAYNLNMARAVVFALLFVVSAAVAVFKPGLGVPAILLVMLLSMSDAYASAGSRGLFATLCYAIGVPVRAYAGLVGVFLWGVIILLSVDCLASWMKEGASILATVNLSGEAMPESRTIDNRLAAGILAGAGLLLFFLQGFGRKLLWARRQPTHFMFAFRVMMVASFVVGLLGLVVRSMEADLGKALAGGVVAFPLSVLNALLSVPQGIVTALGSTSPVLVPSFLVDRLGGGILAAKGLGIAAAASMTTYPAVYDGVLLIGLVGVVGLFIKTLYRTSCAIPGYFDWLDVWSTMVKERAILLGEEWALQRDERRAGVRQRRQDLGASRPADASATVEAGTGSAVGEASDAPAGKSTGVLSVGKAVSQGLWSGLGSAAKGIGAAASAASRTAQAGVQVVKDKREELGLAVEAAKEARAKASAEAKAAVEAKVVDEAKAKELNDAVVLKPGAEAGSVSSPVVKPELSPESKVAPTPSVKVQPAPGAVALAGNTDVKAPVADAGPAARIEPLPKVELASDLRVEPAAQVALGSVSAVKPVGPAPVSAAAPAVKAVAPAATPAAPAAKVAPAVVRPAVRVAGGVAVPAPVAAAASAVKAAAPAPAYAAAVKPVTPAPAVKVAPAVTRPAVPVAGGVAAPAPVAAAASAVKAAAPAPAYAAAVKPVTPASAVKVAPAVTRPTVPVAGGVAAPAPVASAAPAVKAAAPAPAYTAAVKPAVPASPAVRIVPGPAVKVVPTQGPKSSVAGAPGPSPTTRLPAKPEPAAGGATGPVQSA